MLSAGIIVAGWDEVKGGQVYAIPLGGAMIEREYTIGGSGSTYIYGFCDAYYKPNMTQEQCEEFVQKGMGGCMRQGPVGDSVGDCALGR